MNEHKEEAEDEKLGQSRICHGMESLIEREGETKEALEMPRRCLSICPNCERVWGVESHSLVQ